MSDGYDPREDQLPSFPGLMAILVILVIAYWSVYGLPA